jgi:hypothetical protein
MKKFVRFFKLLEREGGVMLSIILDRRLEFTIKVNSHDEGVLIKGHLDKPTIIQRLKSYLMNRNEMSRKERRKFLRPIRSILINRAYKLGLNLCVKGRDPILSCQTAEQMIGLVRRLEKYAVKAIKKSVKTLKDVLLAAPGVGVKTAEKTISYILNNQIKGTNAKAIWNFISNGVNNVASNIRTVLASIDFNFNKGVNYGV